MVLGVTTEFRRVSRLRNRGDVFAKFLYENNNKDGKEPVDLANTVKHLDHELPLSNSSKTTFVFKYILESLHNEVLAWLKQNLEVEKPRRIVIQTLETESDGFGKADDEPGEGTGNPHEHRRHGYLALYH